MHFRSKTANIRKKDEITQQYIDNLVMQRCVLLPLFWCLLFLT